MEIYKDSSQQLLFKVYVDRTLTDADATPTVALKLNGIALPSHTVTQEAEGVYATQLSFSDTFEEGELEATWTFVYDDDTASRTEFHSIVTPYADINYLYELPNTDDEIKWAELYSRKSIEKYTGQKFGRRKAWIKTQGNGTDVLVLPEHIIEPSHIYENGVLIWEKDSTSHQINIEISQSGFAIKNITAGDVIEFYNTNRLYGGGRFYADYTYEVVGDFGYKRVPEDVVSSANLLVDDWFCNNRAWRENYIKRMTNADWSVELDARAFHGTGNSVVDAMLADYVWHRMVVV